MRRSILGLCAISILAFTPHAARAQSAPFPTSKWFQEVVKRPIPPMQLAGPEKLRDFVVDGKLQLSLDQAIQLALANNTNIRIDELTYHSPPGITSSPRILLLTRLSAVMPAPHAAPLHRHRNWAARKLCRP